MAKRQRRRRRERRQEHAKQDGLKTRHSVITGLGVTAGTVIGLAAPAMGASITVSNPYDPGDGTCDPIPADQGCTLREAVDLGNTTSAKDDIYFASNVTGTISLDGFDYGPIGISNPVTIHGPGAGTLKIDAGDDSAIFYTDMVTQGDDVEIDGLTLTHGSNLFGGAINNYDSSLSVIDSILTGNTAFVGGAMYEYGAGGGTYLAFSTLDHNAANYGGAIAANYFFGLIGGSTLTQNQANYGGAVLTANAGPFFNEYIYDSTIANNTALSGGGLYSFAAQSTDTIVANNVGTLSAPDVNSAYFYSYFGLVRNPDITTIQGSPNIVGADPQLFPLGNNGGPTPTMLPAAASPVVDQGTSPVSNDQRHFARTVDNPQVANVAGGNGTDIGAVELTLGEGPQPPVTPQQPTVTKKKKCKKKKKKHSAESAKKKKCKKKKKHSVSAESAAQQSLATWQAQVRSGPRSPRHVNARAPQGPIDWASKAWRFNP
jgi:hypothetical protein